MPTDVNRQELASSHPLVSKKIVNLLDLLLFSLCVGLWVAIEHLQCYITMLYNIINMVYLSPFRLQHIPALITPYYVWCN
jgi:uncharacterized membrane protein YccF (DUF307 family)